MEQKDTTGSISRSFKRFFSGTMISRVTGLGREVLMAAAFGAAPQVAAFWMAFRFSNLLRRMLGEGALNAAFVPQFEKIRNENPQQAAHFFSNLSWGLSGLLFLIILLSECVLGGVWLFGDLEPSNQSIIELTFLMLPSLFFISLYGVNQSLLNCQKSYFIPSVAPAALNLLWIIAVLLLWNKNLDSAMRFLAILVVLAFMVQWLITFPKIFSYLKTFGKPKRNFKQLSILLKPLILGILGVGATQINSVIDAVFARIADERGPAFLWYAIRLQQLPLGLLGVGLTGALLPPISRAIQNKDLSSYFKFLDFSLRRTFLFMIPISGFLLATALSLVNLTYGRGLFSAEDVKITQDCLVAYTWGIVPMTLILIFASACYAWQNYWVPTSLSFLAMLLNAILNAYFVYALHFGAMSIAVATSISAFVNVLLLFAFLFKEKKVFAQQAQSLDLLFYTVKIITCTLLAYIVTAGLSHYLNRGLPREFFNQLVLFGAEACCFSLSFILCAYLLKIKEVRKLLSAKST